MDSFEEAIHRLRTKSSLVEIVYSTPGWPNSSREKLIDVNETPMSISILDSSFNPPTRAHLALASLPPSDSPHSSAYLLLLSVRNADKQLKRGDATFTQRLEMMILLAKDMELNLESPNVAVAAIDEPTFVGKSFTLLSYLSNKSHLPSLSSSVVTPPIPRLVFVIGYDTIVRLFDPKYYGTIDAMHASLDKFFYEESSKIVCARRRLTSGAKARIEPAGPPEATEAVEDEEERAFLSSEYVRPYVAKGFITMVDIGAAEAAMSSTAIRSDVVDPSGGTNWLEMTTDSVARFIVESSLYLSDLSVSTID